jgi:hypothetical protein
MRVWAGVLHDLQGTIVAKSAEGYDSKKLGKLKKNERGKYELYIGNHLLEGSKEVLNKPLVIVYPTERVEAYMGVDELRSSVCTVRGIVREKLLFKTRPNIAVATLGAASDDEGMSADRATLRS